ncbi:MAG: creatininase family protein [Chitinispirillaceae bacterium]
MSNTTSNDLKIENLPFSRVEEIFAQKPAIILPLAGTEPLGESVALGTHNRCCKSVCSALAQKTGIVQAPFLSYGYTTPFRSFGGCGGIKPQILASLVHSILRDYVSQGVRYVCLVDGSYDNYEALLGAAKRVNQRRRARVEIFSWQREPVIRSFIAQQSGLKEPGRSEYGIMSLASFCAQEMFTDSIKPDEKKQESVAAYQIWRRRGKDPEKFRKIFPDSLIGSGRYDPAFGEKLFDRIVSEGAKFIIQTAAEQEI